MIEIVISLLARVMIELHITLSSTRFSHVNVVRTFHFDRFIGDTSAW